MWPVLLKIGPITIYSYGFMLAVGFLTAVWLAKRNIGQNSDFDKEKIIDLVLIMLVFGIIGARLTYVLLNIDEYIRSPLEIIKIHHGGLVFYGGLITAVLAGWILVRRWKWDFLKTGDILMPYAALGHAVGRVGCLLNGCCYGQPTESFVGICLPGEINSLHPTQIYSSLSLLAIFVILRVMGDKVKKRGFITYSYFLLYPSARFTIELFRGDVPKILWGLTFSQIVSVLVFFTAAALKIFSARSGKKI